MSSLEKTYIDAICLAKMWVMDAELKGDKSAAEMFTRILETAIENYKKEFKHE
jgi:hypothetical protein